MRVIWLHWVSSSFRVYFSLFSFLLIYFFYPGRMMGADYCDYTMWPSYIHSCVCQIILWGKKLVTDHRNMSVANGLWLAVFMTLQFSFLRLVFIIDKGKKKKKKKRGSYIYFCLAVIGSYPSTNKNPICIRPVFQLFIILVFLLLLDMGICDILSFNLQKHWRCQAPTGNKNENRTRTQTHIHTRT